MPRRVTFQNNNFQFSDLKTRDSVLWRVVTGELNANRVNLTHNKIIILIYTVPFVYYIDCSCFKVVLKK